LQEKGEAGLRAVGPDQTPSFLLPWAAAVDRALATKLSDAREAMINTVVDSLKAFRGNFFATGQMSSELVCPESLKYLPLFVLALLKHVGGHSEQCGDLGKGLGVRLI
jgi:hypothetical protein